MIWFQTKTLCATTSVSGGLVYFSSPGAPERQIVQMFIKARVENGGEGRNHRMTKQLFVFFFSLNHSHSVQ
jgi:hypothetical protein